MTAVPPIVLVGLSGAAVLALGGTGLLLAGGAQSVRALALATDVVLVFIGIVVAAEVNADEAETLGYVIVGSLVAGSALHVLGLTAWKGALAWTARAVGSVLVCAALIIPTTLTLLLPLVGLLALTLWPRAGTWRTDAH